jgi:predicted RNA-binding protein with RPS1 domain
MAASLETAVAERDANKQMMLGYKTLYEDTESARQKEKEENTVAIMDLTRKNCRLSNDMEAMRRGLKRLKSTNEQVLEDMGRRMVGFERYMSLNS